MSAGMKMSAVRAPVGPIGNHSHRAVVVSMLQALLEAVLTVSPFSHEARDEIAEQQRVFGSFVEPPVQRWSQVVPVWAHLSSKRFEWCQRHGCVALS